MNIKEKKKIPRFYWVLYFSSLRFFLDVQLLGDEYYSILVSLILANINSYIKIPSQDKISRRHVTIQSRRITRCNHKKQESQYFQDMQTIQFQKIQICKILMICILIVIQLKIELRSLNFPILFKMDRFQNIKLVSSPSSQTSPFDLGSSVVTRRGIEPTKLFQQSGVRNQSKYSFADVALAKSGFYSSSSLQQSTVRGVGRGIGNLSEQRLRKIAKQFTSFYGNGSDIPTNGLNRIQREAYDRSSQKPEFNDDSVRDLLKTMDQNRDGRVSEEDILSLCRRYLSCEKRPITYTPMVEQRLAVARRLFKQFDVKKNGFLTKNQVPNLLSETYKALGKTFSATEQDVKSWMKLADGDGDGQVTLPQYEASIIRALKKQGIKIYEE